MKAYEIESYAHGARFTNEDEFFYDAENKKFNDLSGYAEFDNNVVFTNGLPLFVTEGSNSRQGILLDNTTRAEFDIPASWEGCGIIVFKTGQFTGSTTTATPYISNLPIGQSASPSLKFVHFSGGRRISAASGAGQIDAPMDIQYTDENIRIYAFGFSQESRTAFSTVDGVTVTETAPYTNNLNRGEYLAWGSGRKCTMGALTASAVDFDVNPNQSFTVFEHHFFTENVLVTDLTKLKAIIDNLKEYYGIA